jgi:hypothetical protein
MNKEMKRLAAAACLACLYSCGGGLFDEMDRLARDPAIDAPMVRSFVEENRLFVEWSEDAAADGYILERASDSPLDLVYSTVYQGTDTSFTDSDCENQERYLYRLRKLKGDRIFDPSAPVFGVGSITCMDDHEPNDTDEEATVLDYTCLSNVYYYRTFSDEVVQDLDWYSVSIPAGFTAEIVVTQISPPLEPGVLTNYMLFGIQGSPVEPITNNASNLIKNTYSEERTFYFQIVPDPARFLSGMGLAGGTMALYTVTLVRISNI